MKTYALENYSSLHELSLIESLGLNIGLPCKHFFVQFSFNLHTPLKILPQAYLTLHTHDANAPASPPDYCYSFTDLKRWRLDISSYRSFDDYLDSLIRWHRCNYTKSKKKFLGYGCEIRFIEMDWSEHVEQVYQLYVNTSRRYQHWLYDLNFFQEIAKRLDYKLISAWFQGRMVGFFLLQEELPTLHSICCGLDYLHSSASYAYSWMHYALIEHAITAHKYQNVDVGLSADEAKKTIGFKPVLSRMDIYSKGMTRRLLQVISHFIAATLNSEGTLKLKWRKRV
jgi:predicted N-acyltransferase